MFTCRYCLFFSALYAHHRLHSQSQPLTVKEVLLSVPFHSLRSFVMGVFQAVHLVSFCFFEHRYDNTPLQCHRFAVSSVQLKDVMRMSLLQRGS
mmetsp:Transcript_47713/g.88518  ORF Transcript_47713/g.88518 Transcript_47713/m.88518 type:complete len:94 (+) Transcript_47713:125-406(+)